MSVWCRHNQTHAPQQTSSSFDHFVGELLQMERHVEAERLGGLEVDHQFEFGRLLYWEVCRFGATQNAIDVQRRATQQPETRCRIVGAIDVSTRSQTADRNSAPHLMDEYFEIGREWVPPRRRLASQCQR